MIFGGFALAFDATPGLNGHGAVAFPWTGRDPI